MSNVKLFLKASLNAVPPVEHCMFQHVYQTIEFTVTMTMSMSECL